MHIVYIVHCNRGGSGVREAGAGRGGRKLKKKLAGRQVVVVRECKKKEKKLKLKKSLKENRRKTKFKVKTENYELLSDERKLKRKRGMKTKQTNTD